MTPSFGRSFGFQFCFWKNRAPAIPYSKSVLVFRQTRVVSALIALASCIEREPSSHQYGLGATDFNRRPNRESLRRATIAPLNGGLPDIPHANSRLPQRRKRLVPKSSPHGRLPRSEEHTSELQSQFH